MSSATVHPTSSSPSPAPTCLPPALRLRLSLVGFTLCQLLSHSLNLRNLVTAPADRNNTLTYTMSLAGLAFDVAFCQMLYLGTLGGGGGGDDSTGRHERWVDLLCKLAFLVDGVAFFWDRAGETLEHNFTFDVDVLSGVIWIGVGIVSAGVGVPTLDVARVRALEAWRGREVTEERSRQIFFQYGMCLPAMAGVAGWRILVAAEEGGRDDLSAEEARELEITGASWLVFCFILALLPGMYAGFYDCRCRGQHSSPPLRLLGRSLFLSHSTLPFFYVFVLLPTGSYDALEWLVRLQAHIVPGFVVWFVAAYNFDMRPRHLWDFEGAEAERKRRGKENNDLEGGQG